MFDANFAQNVTLLALTAVVTGFLVPYILKEIESRKTLEQKDREAALARQEKLIDSQAALLDSLSQILWKWRYVCMRVAYYGAEGMENQFDQAACTYDDEVWDIFDSFRGEISRSRRLISEDAYAKLLRIYKEQLVALDLELKQARAQTASQLSRRAAFLDLNRRIYDETSRVIDDVLNDLAIELKLSTHTERP
jgi:hypothetical protein